RCPQVARRAVRVAYHSVSVGKRLGQRREQILTRAGHGTHPRLSVGHWSRSSSSLRSDVALPSVQAHHDRGGKRLVPVFILKSVLLERRRLPVPAVLLSIVTRRRARPTAPAGRRRRR